ncbi:MAG: LysR family transcriptional regulator [Eubacteriales bacterium]|nr:LysR family transcriptional regulator [Eubacteriales bacterium]
MIAKNSRYAAFLSVCEHKSVSDAAKKSGISQPAVSAEISALENELGVQLFVRTNRGVKLTLCGQTLYENVKKGISLIEAGEEKVREMASLKSGAVRIVSTDDTLIGFIAEDVATFREQNSGVALISYNSSAERISCELKEGEADVAVIGEPFSGDLSDIKLLSVRETEDVFVCHPTNPLARMSRVTKKQLCEYPINVQRMTGKESLGYSAKKSVVSWLGNGFCGACVESTSVELLISLAERGIGISCVPLDIAQGALINGRVSMIDTADVLPKRKIYLAYSAKNQLSRAAREFINTVAENIGPTRQSTGATEEYK